MLLSVKENHAARWRLERSTLGGSALGGCRYLATARRDFAPKVRIERDTLLWVAV